MKPIITSIPRNLICCDGPYEPYRVRPIGYVPPRRDADDHRPTFAEAINDYCAEQQTVIAVLCRAANLSDKGAAYAARACERVPTPESRAKLASLIGMQPGDIRWPVLAKEAHHG